MGTHTEFHGAIRIVPQVEPELAARLNEYFNIRHMRRSLDALMAEYPTKEDRKARSLMGDGEFGPEGLYYLPVKVSEFSSAGKALAGEDGMSAEGIQHMMDANYPPVGAPSLYCDMVLVPSVEDNCSYLAWSQAEKAYGFPDWFKLIAELLVPLGYHLDGTMFANEEWGMYYYLISVKDTDVRVTDIDLPHGTYEQELDDALAAYENGGPTTIASLSGAETPIAPTLYVDMDGTLAEWKAAKKVEDLLKEGYFLNLAPNQNVVDAIRRLISMGADVKILSHFLSESRYAAAEKRAWVQKHLPEIPAANIWLAACHLPKTQCILVHGKTMNGAVLLDDYTKNLTEWAAAGGTATKLLNGVNGTHGTWTGDVVRKDDAPDDIVAHLQQLLKL